MASEIEKRIAVIKCFPALAGKKFDVTSDPDDFYNCIAWAAGRNHQFWWPGRFWPKGIGNIIKRETFVRAFETVGYKLCGDESLEDGVEKIAIYEKDGSPTHAARQLNDGQWTSKLGRFHDISHPLEGIVGDTYGAPAFFMCRQAT